MDEKEKNTTRVKAGGYLRSLKKFGTLFSLEVLSMVFTIIEGGTASLQGTQLNFSKAEKIIPAIRQSISDARTDARFSVLWQAIVASADLKKSIDEPQFPRQRKVPRRLDDNAQSAFVPQQQRMHKDSCTSLCLTVFWLDSQIDLGPTKLLFTSGRLKASSWEEKYAQTTFLSITSMIWVVSGCNYKETCSWTEQGLKSVS